MIVIIIQKAMELFILLIGNNLVQMDILHTTENILLDLRVILCQFCNQLLNFLPLGTGIAAWIASGTGVCEPTRTLNKP